MRGEVKTFCIFTLVVVKFVNGHLILQNPAVCDEEFGNNICREGRRFVCIFFGICKFSYPQVSSGKPGLNIMYQWSQLEFDYDSESDRQADIDTKVFIPGKPTPIDTDVYYPDDGKESKIFVTIPRFRTGTPVTLGTVSNKTYKGNPVITPYPSWDWHTNFENCRSERIVSVYRVTIDECDRLWVLDTGRFLESQTCPPQILAFDLKTNELVRRSEVPSAVTESRSLLLTLVVDIRDKQCEEAFVYIADAQTSSIIVYNVKEDTFWKATDKTMYPYPNYATINIRGDSFDIMEGVLGMALEHYTPGKDRKLFYHALNSPTENYVYTSHLRNQTIFKHAFSSPEIFHTYRGKRCTQSVAEAIDEDGVLFYGLISETSLACWNTKGEYGDPLFTDIVAADPIALQFPSGVKVVKNRQGVQELWIMTSRFHKVAAGTLSLSETNFRIQAGKVDDLLYGTNCKGKTNSKKSGKGKGNDFLGVPEVV